MPLAPTPSNTPSNTPTPSITASNTPTITPTSTSCPGTSPTTTPSNTATPTQTSTPTGTINATPTQTQTQTQTPSPSGEPETCTGWRIENNTFFDVNWSGIVCGTETSTGGLILVGQTIFTGCIKDGTLGFTGTPTITVVGIC